MAKRNNYDIVEAHGRKWQVRPKKATLVQADGEKASTPIGYAHVPLFDEPTTDEEAKKLVNQWVKDEIFSWRNVVRDLIYGNVLNQFGAIYNAHKEAEGGGKFVYKDASWLYRKVVPADDYNTLEDHIVAVKAKWEADQAEARKNGETSWVAEDHKVFPMTIR